nr:hypothetical protein [uncultured Agrobacterium sp.]
MRKEDIYGAASAKLFSAEELAMIDKRIAQSASLYLDEHAVAAKHIAAMGLVGHREVLEHYLKSNLPMSERQLNVIGLFRARRIPGLSTKGRRRGSQRTGLKLGAASLRRQAGYIIPT